MWEVWEVVCKWEWSVFGEEYSCMMVEDGVVGSGEYVKDGVRRRWRNIELWRGWEDVGRGDGDNVFDRVIKIDDLG